MANLIQIKRGLFSALPTLSAGELGFSTDTKQLHIGDGTDNHEVVMHKLFDAQTLLAAVTDDTPVAVSVGQQTVVGRITGGDIKALSIAEIRTLIGLPDDLVDDGLKIVRVNTGETALEFVGFAATYLDDTAGGTDAELAKAPTSNVVYDHGVATTGVHGASGNTLLHSGSTIDGGAYA